MDKVVANILEKYLRGGVNLDELQSELIKEKVVIYHSELPPIKGQAIHHIDGTPTPDYALRILRTYRQECDCRWATSVDGSQPLSPLLAMMNATQVERAELLDKAIAVLLKHLK